MEVSMLNPKSIQVIHDLYQKTMDHKLKSVWMKSINDNVFQISYPTFTIKIIKTTKNLETGFIVQILNENAELMVEITDNDLTGVKEFQNGHAFEMLQELYNEAQLQAFGYDDKFIDEVIRSL